MKDILKVWIKDKTQLTIWLLCITLIPLSWTLLPENPFVKKPFALIEPIVAHIVISLLVLNIALFVSFIRYHFQIKTYSKLSKIEADITDYEPYQTSNGLNFYLLINDQLAEKRWYCMNCMDIYHVPSVVHPTYENGLKFSWYCPHCKTHLEPFKYDSGNDGSLI